MKQANFIIRVSVLTLTLSFLSLFLLGQSGYRDFQEESTGVMARGMYVLGSWAVINMVTGVYGWVSCEGDRKYFSQMNLFWNTVNLGIAGIALYSSHISAGSILSAGEVIESHIKSEKLFLINSVLDIGYMGAGYLMRHYSGRSLKRAELLKGYGNSVMVQGGFLLVFDLVMYNIMKDIRVSFPGDISLVISPEHFRTGLRFFF